MLLSESLDVRCVFESFILHYQIESHISNFERPSLWISLARNESVKKGCLNSAEIEANVVFNQT